MKKALSAILAISLLVFALPAYAVGPSNQGIQSVYPIDGDCLDREALATMTSATALTAAKVTSSTYGRAKTILFSVKTAAVLCTWNGTDPTTTAGTNVGHLLNAGDSFIVPGYGNIGRFKCINAVNANGAIVEVTFCY